MCISFFDRGNLAVAAPVIAPELHLSPWSLGLLLSAFFWTYSIFQIGAGWLVDRVEVRVVYAAAFLIWSFATLSTAFVSSFAGFLCMRLLLGVGESVTYPATSHILAATFPEQRRGLANSLIDLGARIGPAFGTLCGALLVLKIGWRGLFVITGIGGLIWLIPWLLWSPRFLAIEAPQKRFTVGWKSLLSRREVWGTVGGLCGANYAWYFLLSWLPSYLIHERGFSLGSMAVGVRCHIWSWRFLRSGEGFWRIASSRASILRFRFARVFSSPAWSRLQPCYRRLCSRALDGRSQGY